MYYNVVYVPEQRRSLCIGESALRILHAQRTKERYALLTAAHKLYTKNGPFPRGMKERVWRGGGHGLTARNATSAARETVVGSPPP